MSNDARGFLSRLIYHYDEGRVNRSSMSKIFDAEGFSEEYKSEILGRKPNILRGGKFELFGFLIILSAWLIILGVWFFSFLADIDEPTNIFWFIFTAVVISIVIHYLLLEQNEKILEIQLIFAFMIFINNFIFTSFFWQDNRYYVEDGVPVYSEWIFNGLVNIGLSLTVVLGYHLMAQKHELNFSKILVGLGYFLPFFGLIWYTFQGTESFDRWDDFGSDKTLIFHALLVFVILGMHLLIFSNFHKTYQSWYSRIQTFLIHLNLCWVLWILPFTFIEYFDSDVARFLVIVSILMFYSAFSIFTANKNTELSKRNGSYLAMIPYLLTFSLLPGMASLFLFGDVLDILDEDNFEIAFIPPMLFIYGLAAYHAQSNPFSIKIEKGEYGKRWFNRVILTILIIYMIVFLIILLEEYVFYVFIPAGVIIAGTVVAKVIK
jgi:hypothetical protein